MPWAVVSTGQILPPLPEATSMCTHSACRPSSRTEHPLSNEGVLLIRHGAGRRGVQRLGVNTRCQNPRSDGQCVLIHDMRPHCNAQRSSHTPRVRIVARYSLRRRCTTEDEVEY